MQAAVEQTCAGLATEREEPLDATAAHALEWLAVEHRGPWGRDALTDTTMPASVGERLAEDAARVVLVRRPERREQVCTVFHATVDEGGGTLRRLVVAEIAAVATADLRGGEPVDEPLLLVCAHGRRDPCCARLGVPLFDTLDRADGVQHVWQSTHQGGHRFAPNLLVLPQGIQLGRVRPGDVPEVLRELRAGRIPLGHYRGRTLYTPTVQAAETAARRRHGLCRVDDLSLVGSTDGHVRFRTATGSEISVRVETRAGPVVPVSCGAAPEPTTAFVVSGDL